MLDHHPDLAMANDTHFIPRPFRRLVFDGDVDLTPELVDRVRRYHRFARLGLPEPAVTAAADRSGTYAEFVSALYEALARGAGKSWAGEKTPDYVRHLPFLHRLLPWVKSIHLIRDGRDVALSTLEWARPGKGPGRFSLWTDEPLAVCALWWSWQVGMGRRDGAALGAERYREVVYEDLVSDPEATLHGVTKFLGLPYSPDMLAYHEGRVRNDPALSAKRAWLPPTRGLRDWRDQMASSDVELFEALAGEQLSENGYGRAFPRISAQAEARARSCREWWEGEMARRRAKTTSRGPAAT